MKRVIRGEEEEEETRRKMKGEGEIRMDERKDKKKTN